jgi:hypothetical protein
MIRYSGSTDHSDLARIRRKYCDGAALQLYSTVSNETFNFFANAALGGTRLGNSVAV